MSDHFPVLSSGVVAKYPLTRSRKWRNIIYMAEDLQEQRCTKGSLLESFTLAYNNIKTSDKEILRDFWNSTKGAFDETWSLTINDFGDIQTYTHLQFVPGSKFEAVNFTFDRWRITLQVRQTRHP